MPSEEFRTESRRQDDTPARLRRGPGPLLGERLPSFAARGGIGGVATPVSPLRCRAQHGSPPAVHALLSLNLKLGIEIRPSF